jgi:hypothetical protein
MSKPPNPDNPSSEPEIIPPGQAERDEPRLRVFVGTHGSPLGIILVTLIVGLLSAWSSPGWCAFIFSAGRE